MMVPVTMPKIGLTIEEVEVVEWFRAAGDAVSEGEPLVTVNADKSDVVIDAPATGTIDRILADVGAVVPIGGELAIIAGPGEPSPPTGLAAGSTPPMTPAPPVAQPAPAAPLPARPERRSTGRQRISPYARRVARERGVDVSAVVGSGPGGRIVARDVLAVRPARAPADGPATSRPLASLAATADGVEMIAVTLSHPRVRIVHLVTWAAARTVERLRPEWLTDDGMTIDIDHHDGRSSTARWARSLSFPAWCDRVDESPARGDASRLRVVDLGIDDVEPGLLSDLHPTAVTIAFAGFRSAPRVRDGEVVMRPRLPMAATYDPTAVGPTDAARLIAGTADRLGRIGVLLDSMSDRWHPSAQ